MDELRTKLPDDEETFLGEILSLPSYHKPTYEPIAYRTNDYVDDTPYYNASVRGIARKNTWTIQFGIAEVVLASDEAVSVKVVRIGYVHPSPHAVKTGVWTPRDVSIDIDANHLSQEQAQQARFVIQHLKRET